MKLEPFAMERMQSQWENRMANRGPGLARERLSADPTTR
jgi:hypothetical protein